MPDAGPHPCGQQPFPRDRGAPEAGTSRDGGGTSSHPSLSQPLLEKGPRRRRRVRGAPWEKEGKEFIEGRGPARAGT